MPRLAETPKSSTSSPPPGTYHAARPIPGMLGPTDQPPQNRRDTPGVWWSPGSTSALADFVRHSQSWSGVRAPLPRRLRRVLWALIPVELLWGIWLVIVITGGSPCVGSICTVATLNRHAPVLLVFAVLCLTGLLGLAPTTRGLAQCNGGELVGICVAAAAGGAALLGIAALLLGAVIVLTIFAAFFAALSTTF